jgi:hypothetical protein
MWIQWSNYFKDLTWQPTERQVPQWDASHWLKNTTLTDVTDRTLSPTPHRAKGHWTTNHPLEVGVATVTLLWTIHLLANRERHKTCRGLLMPHAQCRRALLRIFNQVQSLKRFPSINRDWIIGKSKSWQEMLVYCVPHIQPICANRLHFLFQTQQESANDWIWAREPRFEFR